MKNTSQQHFVASSSTRHLDILVGKMLTMAPFTRQLCRNVAVFLFPRTQKSNSHGNVTVGEDDAMRVPPLNMVLFTDAEMAPWIVVTHCQPTHNHRDSRQTPASYHTPQFLCCL